MTFEDAAKEHKSITAHTAEITAAKTVLLFLSDFFTNVFITVSPGFIS
jgi:hypothetical protein